MSTLKRSQIPTRVSLAQCKSSADANKENVRTTKPVDWFKQTKRIRSSSTWKTLAVPAQRDRALSDNAIQPPEKKIKSITTHRSKYDRTSITTRTPLVDLYDNRTKTKSTVTIHKNITVIKTSKNAQKVKEESKHVVDHKFVGETTTTTHDIRYSSVTDSRTRSLLSVNRQKVTVRSSLAPNTHVDIGNNSDIDEVFVDDDLHYINFKPSKTPRENLIKKKFISSRFMSPIKPNLYTARNTVIVQGIPRDVKQPAKKKSLAHKIHLAGTRQMNYPADTEFLSKIKKQDNEDLLSHHDEAMLEVPIPQSNKQMWYFDIVNYQLQNDWKFVIKKNGFEVYNTCKEARTAVVNWLMQAQEYLGQTPVILFTTIRYFDTVLASMGVPKNMYQLVGLVIFWIISKFEDAVNTWTASKMVTLCNGAHSVGQFLRMEMKLLAFFGFDLKLPDITLYASFYIRKLGNESDLFLNSVYYILECYTLNINFSTLPPSVLAAAAVCLAVNILHPLTNEWDQLENVVGFYGKVELENVMQDMLEHIQRVQDPSYAYRQPYLKYATKEKIQASIVLLHKLVAT